MKSRSHIVTVLLFLTTLLLPAPHALAQDSQDDQPHIQPRNSPTPTPTPTPKPAASQPPAQKKDQYDRPPFPGDVQQKPGANEPSPKPSDDKYERPPFPGDAPGTNPTGGSVRVKAPARTHKLTSMATRQRMSRRLRPKMNLSCSPGTRTRPPKMLRSASITSS